MVGSNGWCFVRACALLCLCAVTLPIVSCQYVDSAFEQYSLEQVYLYNENFPLASWSTLPDKWSNSTPIVKIAQIPNHNAIYLQQDNSQSTGLQKLYRMDLAETSSSFLQVPLPQQVEQNFTIGSTFITGQNASFLAIVTPKFIFSCSYSLTHTISCQNGIPFSTPVSKVFDGKQANDGSLWIGTSAGLYYTNANRSEVRQILHVPDNEVTEVIIHPSRQWVYCATADRLSYSLTEASSISDSGNEGVWKYYWIDGLIDGTITSLTYDNLGNLWIGNDICINVLHSNLTFERIGPNRGLPFTNVTSVSYDSKSNNLWVGSWTGAARLEKESSWKYYYGPRWIAGESTETGQNVSLVLGLTITNNLGKSIKTGIVVGDFGLSVIMSRSWTLEQKAAHYQSLVYPRHDMYGLTAECTLDSFGSLDNWSAVNSDNDGLWTSMYLASQCFRYAATKSPDAKKNAWKAFQGLELLNKITGVKGLPARTVFHGLTPPTSGTWYNSSTMPGWIWKGDTSSDEITGHLMVYPLFHDLVCETEEEKALPRNLLGNMTHYIVQNGYYLIDVTGQPTTWGVWAPSQLNGNQTWYTQRGLNSLQILSWLLSAERITNEAIYSGAFEQLAYQYGYAQNIINQKITDPMDMNFSDDELGFLPYLLYYYTGTQDIENEMQLSIFRAWNQLQRENPSLWNFIYSMTKPANGDFGLDGAISTLKEWPVSLINWPVNNSFRKDIHLQRELSRGGEFQASRLLPYDEISMYRWNGNPYQLGSQGSGYSEYDPGAWLMPYWLGVYLGHIVSN